MSCDHVVALSGDYDGGVELLRQSMVRTRIEQCHSSRIAWANGKYVAPSLAERVKAETPFEIFCQSYVVCRYCVDCGEKLPELS